jgi:hypothetical protein
MHSLLPLLAFFLSVGIASPAPLEQLLNKRVFSNGKLPVSFVAFGDSYSAGIGAGRFLTTSTDQRDNECARTVGSYPFEVTSSHPILFGGVFKDFLSCTGDTLSQMNDQIAGVGGKTFDVATVSIGGNDFFFGEIAVSDYLRISQLFFFVTWKRRFCTMH